MDHIYYNDPDDVYDNIKNSAEETYESPPQPIPASFIEVPESKSTPSSQTFDVSDSNRKQRSHRKSFSGIQVPLIVAATIFATLSIVFMVMYFTDEGKRKSCDCQYCNKNMKETSESCDGQNTSRNHTEEKCKPYIVYQNCSLVTNCSKSKTNSTANYGQCPAGCVNSTMRKLNYDTVLKSTGCAEFYKKGAKLNGVYTIDPDGFGAFNVRCDMTTSGGGWTVFQRRVDGSVDFYRSWKNYTEGFGNLSGEFWLGLDKINRLTESEQNVLRVDMEDFENETRYVEYKTFDVWNEAEKYKLTIGRYTGNAGDSLANQNGMKFSTRDMDNDADLGRSCAQKFKGAWWYNRCHDSNLNGQYLRGHHSSFADGINWDHWRGYYYSLKKTEMKIRPSSF